MGVMEFKRAITAGAISAFLLVSTTVQAAMVQPVSGQVMINQGQGYQTINNPIEAKTGDQIIVNPGGYAKITYTDGCTIPVNPGAVATIGAESPCIAQAQQGDMAQGGSGAGGAAGTGVGTGTLVAIGLGIAAAVGIGVAASSGGSSKKAASP